MLRVGVGDKEEEADSEEKDQVESFNRSAKFIFVLAVVVFQFAFWVVSLSAYLAGPETYMNLDIE